MELGAFVQRVCGASITAYLDGGIELARGWVDRANMKPNGSAVIYWFANSGRAQISEFSPKKWRNEISGRTLKLVRTVTNSETGSLLLKDASYLIIEGLAYQFAVPLGS